MCVKYVLNPGVTLASRSILLSLNVGLTQQALSPQRKNALTCLNFSRTITVVLSGATSSDVLTVSMQNGNTNSVKGLEPATGWHIVFSQDPSSESGYLNAKENYSLFCKIMQIPHTQV